MWRVLGWPLSPVYLCVMFSTRKCFVPLANRNLRTNSSKKCRTLPSKNLLDKYWRATNANELWLPVVHLEVTNRFCFSNRYGFCYFLDLSCLWFFFMCLIYITENKNRISPLGDFTVVLSNAKFRPGACTHCCNFCAWLHRANSSFRYLEHAI